MVVRWDGLHRLAGFDDMDEFWDWAHGGDRRPSIFRHLELLPGALDTLRALDAEGHDVVIVTTKPEWAVHETLHWIAEHALPTHEVHITLRKADVACDVYLDDSPVVLPELVAARPDALVCRFVRPWNDPVDGAVDTVDWAGFHLIVTERAAVARDSPGDLT